VPVFYDPANPAESVLERKPSTSLGCIWGGAIIATANRVAAEANKKAATLNASIRVSLTLGTSGSRVL
jgi:hypothetical protein